MMDQFIVSTHGDVRYLCIEDLGWPCKAWLVIKRLS